MFFIVFANRKTSSCQINPSITLRLHLNIYHYSILISILVLQTSAVALAGDYAPAAGEVGTTAISKDSSIIRTWAIHSEIIRGRRNISDEMSELATHGTAENATGMADNTAVSLGDGGVAVLTFEHPIMNAAGADFCVFENAFAGNFLELAHVEVSSNGIDFLRFPSHSMSQTQTQVASFGTLDPTDLHNLAGKYEAGFGTPFDLDDLPIDDKTDLTSITHVRIIDVVGSIDPLQASYDSHANAINDPWPTDFESSGFDLDAVGVINVNSQTSVPPVSADLIEFTNNSLVISGYANSELSVYTLLGKEVFTGTIYSSISIIDLSNLGKGAYFVVLSRYNTFHSKKIFIFP